MTHSLALYSRAISYKSSNGQMIHPNVTHTKTYAANYIESQPFC